MSLRNGNISRKKGQKENNSWTDTDKMLNPVDLDLFRNISDYMMGCIDIEDVKSDPLYKETNDAAIEMTSGFDHNDSMHKANAKYISDNITGKNEDEKLDDEINDIKKDKAAYPDTPEKLLNLQMDGYPLLHNKSLSGYMWTRR